MLWLYNKGIVKGIHLLLLLLILKLNGISIIEVFVLGLKGMKEDIEDTKGKVKETINRINSNK
jgi:hypothetical protein